MVQVALDLSTLDPSMAVGDRRELMLLSVRPAGGRTPLAGEIFDELAIGIIEGRIRPGETLSSADLARRFGTSRTPVRDALAELERQAAIVVPPRRRPYVVHATPKQIKDNYDIRACLFGLVSELIVEACTRDDLRKLWSWQDGMEEAAAKGSVDDFFWHSVGFRLVEVELAGNGELKRLVSSLGIRTLQIRHMSVAQPGRMQRSVIDHRRLLEAYEEGDRITATAMTRLLVTTGYRFLERAGIVGPTEGPAPEAAEVVPGEPGPPHAPAAPPMSLRLRSVPRAPS
jgi:DNA-binding GntR family transcriptional regulator